MRKLLLLGLAAGLSAFGCRDGTAPDAHAIEVRVTDDRGAPVDRMRVVVSLSHTDRVRALTRKNGIVRIGVREPGSYLVTVIPRAGYIGAPGTLATTVVVADERSTVGFTVHREGWVPPPPIDEGY